MATKQVALSVSAFLDSRWAARLRGIDEDVVRKIAEDFVELCYSALGKEPRFLDGEDVRALVVSRLPGRFAKKDANVAHVRAVLSALIEHLAESAVMTQLFEVKNALGPACEECVAIVRSGRNAPEAQKADDPFVHGASKLGRNDPCSCGSGQKYKKCHGKNA